MIGTISIKCNAAHPEMALPTVFAYVSSPSSIRIIDVPKKIGKWKINEVSLTFAYPDGSIVSAPCVLTGGVWVATVDGTSTSGTSKNGFTIFANGTDENGDSVNGYILGKGDLNVLDADGELHPEELKWYVRLVDEEPEEPKTGDLFRDVDYYIYDSNGQKRALGVTHPELTIVNNKANTALVNSDEAKQVATQAISTAAQAATKADGAINTSQEALTVAENALELANAADTKASSAKITANNAYNQSTVAINKANDALPKTDVVAPSLSATQGQAADALATSNALDGKVDKSGDTMTGGLTVPNLTVGSRESGTVIGANSSAAGNHTIASGIASHAEGKYTQAHGEASHAEGTGAWANGIASHAEGGNTIASGDGSHAEGYETRAQNEVEHAQGHYNVSHTGSTDDTKTIHSIGVGTSTNNRKNAVETMQDGKTYIYGLGNYNGTNPTGTGVKDLATSINDKLEATSAAQAWSSEVEWPAWKTCSYKGVIYENTSGSTIQIGTTTTPDTPNSSWTKKRVDELFLSRMGGRIFGTLDVWNGDITTENNFVAYSQSRLELYNDSSRTGDYTHYAYGYIETGHNPTGPDDTEEWYETFSFPRIHAEGDTLVSEITLSNHLSSKVDGDGVLKIQSITQAAYDALATKDATTLYVING